MYGVKVFNLLILSCVLFIQFSADAAYVAPMIKKMAYYCLNESVVSLGFVPTDNFIATVSIDGLIILRDLRNRNSFFVNDRYKGISASDLIFSREGVSLDRGRRSDTLGNGYDFEALNLNRTHKAIACGHFVYIYDVNTRFKLCSFEFKDAYAVSIAFSKNGRQIAVGCREGCVVILSDMREIPWAAGTNAVVYVSF